MDILKKYNETSSWSEKIALMGVYHFNQLEINKKWTIRQTADQFKVSTGLVSENLHLAILFRTIPTLRECKTRKEALGKIDRRKFPLE